MIPDTLAEAPLGERIDQARRRLWEASSDEELRLWCQWSMAQLSQAAAQVEGAIALPELRRRFPHWEVTLRRVRHLERCPSADLGTILHLLKHFGRFLARNVESGCHVPVWLPRDCAPTALPTHRNAKVS